jgi:hypothetical protein
VVLGAVLYRQGEYTRAAETLDQLTAPLSEVAGGLARDISPADDAFEALVHARLGHDARARKALDALRAAFEGQDVQGWALAVLREAEALLEPTAPPTGDG